MAVMLFSSDFCIKKVQSTKLDKWNMMLKNNNNVNMAE